MEAAQMKLTADHYLRTSLERMGQAQSLYRLGGCCILKINSAGLAVECMLRAFKLRRDASFDEKHDLRRLFRSSGILNINPATLITSELSDDQIYQYMRALQRAVNDVCVLWANDFRFASEKRLRSHLFRLLTVQRRAKGDFLKTMC